MSYSRHVLIISLLTCSACTDSGVEYAPWGFAIPENTSLVQANLLIVGEWEWVKTVSSGLGPEVEYTPHSEGYTHQLRFFQSGSVEMYRNNALIGTTTFAIDSGYYSRSFTLVIAGATNYAFRVSANSLSFDTRPVDGRGWYLRRR